MTIREALARGNTALATGGIETPGLDASLLLAEVLNISRSLLYAAGSDQLTETAYAAFDDFIKRRLAGECAAYILGRKEFYGLEFLVNPSVLVPRPDTEILVETALDGIRSEELGIGEQGAGSKGRGLRVLDLCTGSGAIAIALKNQIPELEIWATDISDEALKVAKTNATRLLSPESIYFCQGDLFDAFLLPIPNSSLLIPNFFLSIPHSSFSLILSNPPYVPTAQIPGLSPDVRAEPILALDGGSDGLDFIRTIVSRAPEFLCPGGTLLLEADPCQMEVIAALLQQMGFVNIQIHKDLSGRERVIGARKVN